MRISTLTGIGMQWRELESTIGRQKRRESISVFAQIDGAPHLVAALKLTPHLAKSETKEVATLE